MDKDLVEQFELLHAYYRKNQDTWRAKAYAKAVVALKTGTTEGIGKKIAEKIAEYRKTGKIALVEKVKKELALTFEKDKILEDLENVWGIGQVKAKKLYEEHNIRSIEQLRNNQELLTTQQRIGLKYYEDLQNKIPRQLITAIYVIIKCYLDKVFGKDSYKMNIAGSYRRGASQSGDIDCLISSDVFSLVQAVELLKRVDVITDVLSMRNEKMLGIAHCKEKYFRLDIEFIPREKYYFALLYFTGSQKHNIHMRMVAKKQGLLLNEHGLYDTQGESVLDNPRSEEEIFEALGMEFVKPENR